MWLKIRGDGSIWKLSGHEEGDEKCFSNTVCKARDEEKFLAAT
jgi:hypothetical protein